MRAPGAVVVGGYINGVGVVRSLISRGIPTAVILTQPHDVAHRSRHVSGHESALGLVEQPDLLLEVLDRRERDWHGWALVPANDEALTALSQHHEKLSRNYRVVAPPWEIVRHVLDKALTRQAAEVVGVALPRCYGPAVPSVVQRADLRFPVLVKPNVGHLFSARFGRKLFFCSDRDDLRRCIDRVGSAGIACEIFDHVPGPDDALYFYCTYIDRRGEPSPGVCVHKLRQSPPRFGVARVAELVEEIPQLRDPALEVVRKLRLRGIVAAEFKHDARDGTFRLLEINARSSIYNGLLRKAGLDTAALAWADQVEGQPEACTPMPWPGVWINLHADLVHSTLSRREGPVGLAEFLAPYRRPKVEALWSARDPLPFLTQWSHTGRDAWRGRRLTS